MEMVEEMQVTYSILFQNKL